MENTMTKKDRIIGLDMLENREPFNPELMLSK